MPLAMTNACTVPTPAPNWLQSQRGKGEFPSPRANEGSESSPPTMGWSSGPTEKAKALQKAAEYCNGMGKELQTISANDSGPGGFGKISSAEVQFRCVQITK